MGNGTNIGRVRGLGSAKHGSEHWLKQRLTAIGNIVLVSWLVVSLLLLPNFEYETVATWLAKPSVAVPMILVLFNVFSHLRLGLQVFIEDYVHDEGNKFAALAILNFYAIGGAAFGIFMVAKHAFTFTGAPA
ncbi:MAG: succinate dehydrogenase, hydrophobic membrane anchor protein [Sphingorhabdus sp.]